MLDPTRQIRHTQRTIREVQGQTISSRNRHGEHLSERGNAMRDLNALLNSLVNIDRDSLIAVLSSEAEDAERLARHGRQRTPLQRTKKREAVERVARIKRILLFMQHGETALDISDADLNLCKSLEDRLRGRAQP
jgi:hypothetical protein